MEQHEGIAMMKTENGQKLAGALKAVAQMHSDTSKLLVDCDKHIGKNRKPIFGNYVTRNLTYHVRADHWMPEGVFRYYQAGPLLVDGVSVTFFNSAQPEYEPLLKVARIAYSTPEGTSHSDSVCDVWDIWGFSLDTHRPGNSERS